MKPAAYAGAGPAGEPGGGHPDGQADTGDLPALYGGHRVADRPLPGRPDSRTGGSPADPRAGRENPGTSSG
ncbi:hypothetical protein GCM10022222_01690 [Amycolatopsis ultiminotia]|uniref:Uncharacterized protein n=1 Tax=Amycolatopsis ultiminotia TaxID=543629 RepID=A0ABP6UY10_9PSEU